MIAAARVVAKDNKKKRNKSSIVEGIYNESIDDVATGDNSAALSCRLLLCLPRPVVFASVI